MNRRPMKFVMRCFSPLELNERSMSAGKAGETEFYRNILPITIKVVYMLENCDKSVVEGLLEDSK